MNYDVIVIGCGPAVYSAAINVRQRGGSVICVGTAPESNALFKAEKIDNYPGMPGMTGAALLEAFRAHAEQSGAQILQERVISTFYTGTEWMVSAGSNVLTGKVVIFAGGVSRGKTYEGEEALIGKGVSYCATCDGMLYRKKDVVVIGFSAADREEAEFLTKIGCSVQYFEKPKKVSVIGTQKVTAVSVDGQEYAADGVFILRPTLAPNTLFGDLELNGSYIRVNRENMETNVKNLLACGDCTGRPLQVANAVGQGLVAGQHAMELVDAMKKE